VNEFTVRQVREGTRLFYAVFLGQRQMSRHYASEVAAEGAADRLAREARYGRPRSRPCLCCGQDFASQGVHNRLCARCNRRSLPGAV